MVDKIRGYSGLEIESGGGEGLICKLSCLRSLGNLELLFT